MTVTFPHVCRSLRVFTTLACALIVLAATGCHAPGRDVSLRVMTYNIHHGEGTDGVFDLDRLARVIREQRPDIVALQEVDVQTSRAGGVDQAATLGVLTGMHAAFGTAMAYDGGQYGEAVLSRFPIDEARAIALPASQGREPRCALLITAVLPDTNRSIAFIGTHLDHLSDDSNRVMQIESLLEALDDRVLDLPVILAGDLNDTASSRILRTLRETFVDCGEASNEPTFPSDSPDRRIDYVLLRPIDSWSVRRLRVVDERIASDHRPVVVDLVLKGR